MSARQIVVIGLRLFALWLCIGALQLFAITQALQSLSALFRGSDWIGLLLVAVLAGIALLVWVMSGPIANGLLSGLSKTQEVALSALDMVRVGCVLMGLWWLKESVIPFIGFWLRAIAVSSTGQSAFDTFSLDGKLNMIMTILRIGIALIFVLRPNSIAAWVLRPAPFTHEDAGGQDATQTGPD